MGKVYNYNIRTSMSKWKKNCLEERPVQTFEWNKLLKEKEDEDE
jgi:hypothetical protein